jgi:hypothetical protein
MACSFCLYNPFGFVLWDFLETGDQHKKRRDVGEEMTLHISNAVTFSFILAGINLFSGLEHRLSLTNDRHLDAS